MIRNGMKNNQFLKMFDYQRRGKNELTKEQRSRKLRFEIRI